jgi:hypothetical protein
MENSCQQFSSFSMQRSSFIIILSFLWNNIAAACAHIEQHGVKVY